MSECTKEQYDATHAPFDKPVAIVACPGSGKTFTIIHRVAYLLQNGFATRDLLIITFTRKASIELKQRLSAMGFNVIDLSVMTFHSFGLMVLRKFGHLINLNHFRIINEKEQMELIDSISGEKFNKDILLYLQLFKNNNECDDELRPIFEKYNAQLRSLNMCDFTDLINLPLELMRRNTEVLNFYQKRYKYGLVDEMQDVSRPQFDLVSILFGSVGRLTVVGDDDQTIYGWRGASAKLLLDFQKVFPGSLVLTLTLCFRCPEFIVKAMSKLIQENKIRVKKIIRTDNKSTSAQKIIVYGALTPVGEAEMVCKYIKKMKGSIAILFRTKRAASFVRIELSKNNIGICTSEKPKYLETKDVDLLLNILQLVAGIEYNKKVVTNNILHQIRTYFDQQSKSTYQPKPTHLASLTHSQVSHTKEDSMKYLSDSDDEYNINLPGIEIDDNFVQSTTIKNNKTSLLTIPIEKSDIEAIKLYLANNTIIELINTITTALKINNKDSIKFVVKAAEDFGNGDLIDFLDCIRTEQEVTQNERQGVFMSTIHQAKGLEFDNVFLIGATKGIFPLKSSDPIALEEERRLFYVAISRAKKTLTISFIMDKGPSMYVTEIPECMVKSKIEKPKDENEILELKQEEHSQNYGSPPMFRSVLKLHADSQPSHEFVSSRSLNLAPQKTNKRKNSNEYSSSQPNKIRDQSPDQSSSQNSSCEIY